MFSFSSYTIFVLFPKADLPWLLKFVSARFQRWWGYPAFTFSGRHVAEQRVWGAPPWQILKDLSGRKASQVLWGPCSLAGISSAPWGWLEAGSPQPWGWSPLFCSSHELASGAGSASGVSWAEICKYLTDNTEREKACPCQQKSSQAWAFWRRKHCSLVSFTEQGICPDPGGTCDPSPGHQNLGTVLWPRLNHHSWLCSCILMLCTYCHILGYISYSELKLLSISDQFLLIWKGWTLNSCCLISWNINIRLERCPWLGALNIRKCIHRTILLFQDHLWQFSL